MNALIILVSNLVSIIFAAASWHLCNQGKEGWGWMAGFAIATATSVNFRKESKP